MTSHQVNGVPKTPSTRPTLPYAQINPHLALLDNAKPPAVKYQVITRDGQEIIVGRVKIQTPNGGHAFVLRRFDTGAISQTTMFRAAFPSAGEDIEKSESNWVKQTYDSTGANGGTGKGDTLRLAGVWVRPEVAKTLAPEYSLEHIVDPLFNALPDPAQEYRRSTKPGAPAQSNGAVSSPTKTPSGSHATRFEVPPPSSSPPDSPKPAKRRKETTAPVVTSPKKATLDLPTTTPRRSGRTTSPAPIPAPATPIAATPVTRATRTKSKTWTTTAAAGSGAVSRLTPEDDYDRSQEEVADVPGPSMQEDVAEQKELIAKLKAERVQAQKVNVQEEEPEAGPSSIPLAKSESTGSSKRSREDVEEKKPLKFQFREPGEESEVARRKIRSNRRISLDLEPQQKSAAWGALWFAAGLAAAATIPSLFM